MRLILVGLLLLAIATTGFSEDNEEFNELNEDEEIQKENEISNEVGEVSVSEAAKPNEGEDKAELSKNEVMTPGKKGVPKEKKEKKGILKKVKKVSKSAFSGAKKGAKVLGKGMKTGAKKVASGVKKGYRALKKKLHKN